MRRSTDVARAGRAARAARAARADKRQLAVASVTLGPWRPAAAVGAIGGGVSLALSSISGDFGLGVIAGSLSVALMLFFLVGGAGAALGRKSGTDHRIRRWARAHPWQVAAVPAGMLLVTDFAMRQLLTAEGFFGSLWDGLWRAAIVAGVVGAVGSVSAGRRG